MRRCDARMIENSQPFKINIIISRSFPSIEQMRLGDDDFDNKIRHDRSSIWPHGERLRIISFDGSTKSESTFGNGRPRENIWSPINYSMNSMFNVYICRLFPILTYVSRIYTVRIRLPYRKQGVNSGLM